MKTNFKPGDRVQFLNNHGVVAAVNDAVDTVHGQYIAVIWDPHTEYVHISNLQLEDK
jgi:hypothetical protein